MLGFVYVCGLASFCFIDRYVCGLASFCYHICVCFGMMMPCCILRCMIVCVCVCVLEIQVLNIFLMKLKCKTQ